MKTGIERIAAAGFACAVLFLGGVAHGAEDTTIADALDRLQLTPQQLVSLREFFGQFGHDSKVEGTTTGDGTTVLDLRDSETNEPTGQLVMRTNTDGSVSVARLTGSAHFDNTHIVMLPLFADSKKRDEIAAAMATSTAGAWDPTTPTAPQPFMQSQKLMRLTLDPLKPADVATAPMRQVSQAQATFFPDGSGFASGLRATAVPANAPKTTRVPTLHLFGRYLSKLESDGLRIFRAKTVELAGDAALSFDDFETKLACNAPGHCGAVWSLAAPDIASSLHVMRRANATVPRAPLDLVTSLAPPPVAQSVLPSSPAPLTANPSKAPVTAVFTPPSQPTVTTPPATTVPERDEIGEALQGSSAPQR